ncbi:MAG TPA: acetyl-CoA carboxylase biotin carboxyl carrier protein subunit [Thermoanaerobacterales bacterium]|uniref:biotin/lipoyl-containing protein n=1 Tax=Tepidanaerobacter sp. GT38 TaxID=2722793 RepID=UPI0017C8AD3A|nr:biotin/lipoyl-containing protein [Tepidanaerobacter sp. GT38]MCG1011974.1 acetyl-CoA carboxylase biotin carboxyl carrier protein subunit [Tepidanaerobacter sp. GT38]HHY42234.1 acetyl-CoA carboxylase biotin carboxyl carrier protein subunit [Thermoanaerobacterales bacterium]
MKKYKITVNGQTYEVEVEEIGGTFSETTPAQPEPTPAVSKVQQPQPQPKPQAKPKTSGTAGKNKITAPMPGTILSIKKKPGDKIQKGDVIMILEAMKMENEIVAPDSGTITSIDISEGASVNTGDTLATFE